MSSIACTLCNEDCLNFGIGACNHCICGKCAIKIRVICKSLECPICRSTMARICIVSNQILFGSIDQSGFIIDEDHEVLFESRALQSYYIELMQPRCKVCDLSQFSMSALNRHTAKEHQKFYCDLCMKNLKLFPSEFTLYTNAELVKHRRWEPNNPTHGHPMCQFCENRFFDVDMWYSHLRREHFMCHICENCPDRERYDQTRVVYCSYPDLSAHFHAEHFVCEEGSCYGAQFTNIFATEADLKVHRLASHTLSRADRKEVQRLQVDVTFTNDNNARFGNGRGRRGHASSTTTTAPGLSGADLLMNPDELTKALAKRSDSFREDPEDFPDLCNDVDGNGTNLSSGSVPTNRRLTQITKLSTGNSSFTVEDFPSLSNSTSSKAAMEHLSSSTQSWKSAVGTSKSYKPIATNKARATPAVDLPNLKDFPDLGVSKLTSHTPNWVQPKTQKDSSKKASLRPSVAPVANYLQNPLDFPSLATNGEGVAYKKQCPTMEAPPKKKQTKNGATTKSQTETLADSDAQRRESLPVPTLNSIAAEIRADPKGGCATRSGTSDATGNWSKVQTNSHSLEVSTQKRLNVVATSANDFPAMEVATQPLPSWMALSNDQAPSKKGQPTKSSKFAPDPSTTDEYDFPTLINSSTRKIVGKSGAKKLQEDFCALQVNSFDEESEPSKSKLKMNKKKAVGASFSVDDFPQLQNKEPMSHLKEECRVSDVRAVKEESKERIPVPHGFHDLSAALFGAVYHPVIDMAIRESSLTDQLYSLLSQEQFEEFASASVDYRLRNSSAAEYVARVTALKMPDDLWPELLILLPDIPAQRQLLSALPRDSFARMNLTECPRCGQVNARLELAEHVRLAHEAA